MELTINDLRDLLCPSPTINTPSLQSEDWSRVGRSVCIRTVTHTYTGYIAAETDRWLILEDCAWIAQSGRWADWLTHGVQPTSEIEPMPNGTRVAIAAIVDIAPWAHDLPTEQQ